MFNTTIHKSTLTGVEKLQYLKSLLRGEAASLVRHIQVTEGNYIGALNKLKERYDKKKFIVKSFIKSFIEQTAVQSQNISNLRKLRDVSDEVLRGLRALGNQAESRDPWIIYIISQKLDESSKLAWADYSSNNDNPTIKDFFLFLDKRIGTFESLIASTKQNSRHNFRGHLAVNEAIPSGGHDSKGNNFKFKCAVCSGQSHSFMQCSEFQTMPATKRKEFIQIANRCFNCLSSNHPVAKCPSNRRCQKCAKKHHTLLHFTESNESDINKSSENNESKISSQTSAVAYASIERGSLVTILPTARVEVASRYGKPLQCRALLDCGSQVSFVTEECVKKLGLRKVNSRVIVSGVGEMNLGPTKGKVKLSINIKNHVQYQLEALVLPRITSALPAFDLQLEPIKLPDNIELADPEFWRSGTIDVLIGADYFFSCLKTGQKQLNKSKVILQETIFGWVASGKANEGFSDQTVAMLVTRKPSLIDIDKTLRKFWEVECIGKANLSLTEEEQLCESKFLTTTRADSDGRFIVELPFKQSPARIGQTLPATIKRLQGIERRFYRDAEYKRLYCDFMKEYEAMGHMEDISQEEISKPSCYLPHHGVWRTGSSTTKLRVVFDGSAKSNTGVSLNEYLAAGPVVQPSLYSTICRFREFPIVFSADAEKMYRQVKISRSDSDYQRIVWRADVSEPIRHFRLLTVTYGLTSASYLATRVLSKIGDDCADVNPMVSKIIKNCFYVDDLMAGAQTVEDGQTIIKGLITVLGTHGFTLRKWKSNNKMVLTGIEDVLLEKTAKTIEKSDCQDYGIKILGLGWNPVDDVFVFNSNLQSKLNNLTKRMILSAAGKLFDPMGWLAPTIVMIKIFMQQLWCKNLDWDDTLPKDLTEQWANICNGFNEVEAITIPRFIGTFKNAKVDIHAFCDASLKAYAAVVYYRIIDENNQVRVQLVSAKTKVAPMKTLSLPRLELCGAVLLVELVATIKAETSMEISDVIYWTDSKIVLDWLESHPRRWSIFVGNRTFEVLTRSKRKQWKHISSEENPADCASRGTTPTHLKSHRLWWYGPEWLGRNEEQWPAQKKSYGTTEEESNKIFAFHGCLQNKWLDEFILRFSSYQKTQKTLSYIFRFFQATRKPKLFQRESKLLTSNELEQANNILCRYEQQKFYSAEIAAIKNTGEVNKKSSLASLTPFLDRFDLLRVGGRLHHSLAPYSMKHPIILHPKSRLSWLLLWDEHQFSKHAGPILLMSLIKQLFWIPKGKVITAKKVVDQCTICTRYKAELRQQLMGNLPSARVNLERPFLQTGVDFAGPFSIHLVKGRGQKIYKAYVCIFVCMAIKAIHLELVNDLTSDAFLGALKRFVSRRGGCRQIYSDNGTNFVGANTKLIQSFNKVIQKSNDRSNFLCSNNIDWQFNPPNAPHFGGLWETGVKSFKFHFKRVTGCSILTLEEMNTLLAEIESILNHRPLCRSSDDEVDFLTPAHFLHGYPPKILPALDTVFDNPTCSSRWRKVRDMSQHFWSRWYSEYLTQLQRRNKWKENNRDIKINDLVIIQDKGLPVSHWPMGKFIEIHSGADNKVRVVTLKTEHGQMKRPIHRLCLLPCS